MKNPALYLEISNSNFVFTIGKNDDQENFEIIYRLKSQIEGFENNRINDFEKLFNSIKEKIYIIEQKVNFTFKELTLIIDNLEATFINLSGYKKLNGSQISRENITYIINTLKSYVGEIENKKSIIHIFNTKFNLDYKKIENLPIGLFGDFYSHELSFSLIKTSDYKNFEKIFNNCNLKIKKILFKNFVKGVYLSNNNKNLETFIQIKINKKNSQIFLFENNSLKYEQDFRFGSEIIYKDISKITSLKIETVEKILRKINFNQISDEELIEQEFFDDIIYRKIKKKLIYEIIFARVKEISELIIFKNINFKYYNNKFRVIFLDINEKLENECLGDIFSMIFSLNNRIDIKRLDGFSSKNLVNTANRLVHFGWKKEAIPISQSKKSLLARFFDSVFG